MSNTTVRRTLYEAGLGSKAKHKKPKLTNKQIKNRLEFAKCHEHCKLVVFSDEIKTN
jgi:hypothetical protein